MQVFLTNSSNVFLLEPCQDVAKLLDNQVEVCKGVLSIYRHMIMEHTMNTQTWSAAALAAHTQRTLGKHNHVSTETHTHTHTVNVPLDGERRSRLSRDYVHIK